MLIQVNLIAAAIMFLFMLYAAYVFAIEGEIRAMLISVCVSIIIPVPFLLPFMWDVSSEYLICLDGVIVFVGLLFLYNPKQKKHTPERPVKQMDERIAMFSRNNMSEGSSLFNKYYEKHPEHIESDRKFRAKPGLLDSKSVFFHDYGFMAGDASFETIEALFPLIKGKPAANKKAKSPTENTTFILNWAKKLGALDAGITEMKDYHFYSHKGRGERYGKKIDNSHNYGIAFTVEMSEEFTRSAPYSPIIMESAQQYLNAAVIATQLASFIRACGYEATAQIDGNYEVVCPLVAKDAGLGEIGRMGLLMTPMEGPRVRIAVVTTNMPLDVSKAFDDFSMISFCSLCKKCAYSCPSKSISFDNRTKIDGVKRWQINQESCFTYWCTVGTDCGRCMQVCPYSHPNNLLHNLIRFGIKNSLMFRVLAVHLDDLFYGKRPKPKALPKWFPKMNKKRNSLEYSEKEFLKE